LLQDQTQAHIGASANQETLKNQKTPARSTK